MRVLSKKQEVERDYLHRTKKAEARGYFQAKWGTSQISLRTSQENAYNLLTEGFGPKDRRVRQLRGEMDIEEKWTNVC